MWDLSYRHPDHWSFSISSASALTASLLSAFLSVTTRSSLTLSVSPFSSFPTLLTASASAFFSLFFSSFPGFLGEEIALDVEGSVITGLLLLFSSRSLGKGDFQDGKETFLSDSD